jgi:hypothetical protein
MGKRVSVETRDIPHERSSASTSSAVVLGR